MREDEWSGGVERDRKIDVFFFTPPSGLLALPFAFRAAGLALATLLIATAAFAARASLRLLLASAGAARTPSLAGVARAAFGPPGAATARAAVAVLNFAALVAYVTAVGDTLSGAAAAAALVAPRSAVAIVAATTVGAATAAAAAAPRTLTALSALAVGGALAFAACLAATAATGGGGSSTHPSTLALWRPAGMPAAAPLLAYAFTCHVALFDLYKGLRSRNLPTLAASVDAALALAAATHAAVGAAGYAAYGDATEGDVGANLAAGGGGAGARCVFALALVGGAPLVLRPLSDAVFGGGGDDDDGDDDAERGGRVAPRTHSRASAASRGALLLTAAAAAATALPRVEAGLALAGATAGVVAGFWLPAACYARLRPAPRRRPLSAVGRKHSARDTSGLATAAALVVAGAGVAAAGVASVFG